MDMFMILIKLINPYSIFTDASLGNLWGNTIFFLNMVQDQCDKVIQK